MSEEEQEKLYKLLFKDTKNKLETIIEKQQKEIKELKREKDISISVMNTKSMFLESISKELELTDEKTEGFVFTDIIKEIRKLKKIIDKQQKEIEALELIHETYKEVIEDIENRYISKDKIREKIKEYQNKLFQDIEENKVVEYENIIQVLKELLKEN